MFDKVVIISAIIIMNKNEQHNVGQINKSHDFMLFVRVFVSYEKICIICILIFSMIRPRRVNYLKLID